MSNVYINKIKEIINKPEIKDAINNRDFEKVYEILNSIDYKIGVKTISCLTKIFYDIGIDPLLYMKKVPDFFLIGQKEISQINIPTHIKTIGQQAFAGTNITNLIIPEGVEYIGFKAFVLCRSLTNIKLPSTLKYIPGNKIPIENGAFSECLNIRSIEYAGTKNDFQIIFYNNLESLNYKIVITCQDGKMKYRKKTKEWVYID